MNPLIANITNIAKIYFSRFLKLVQQFANENHSMSKVMFRYFKVSYEIIPLVVMRLVCSANSIPVNPMNCVNSPKKLTEFSRLIGGIYEQSIIFSAKKSFAA